MVTRSISPLLKEERSLSNLARALGIVAAIFALGLGGCGTEGAAGIDGVDGQDGAEGPAGPAGPEGPEGPAGQDGQDGQDGLDGQDGADFQLPDNEYAGVKACLTCHVTVGSEHLGSKHVIHSSHINASSLGACQACHDPLGEGIELERYLDWEHIPAQGLSAVTCEACHGPSSNHVNLPFTHKPEIAAPRSGDCGACHAGLPADHLAYHPFADEIGGRFDAGRHTGRAREGACAACHSHEGAVAYLTRGRTDTRGDLEAGFVAPEGPLTAKTCTTCHQDHDFELRSREVTADFGGETRVVYSQEFQLCTSCHQTGLDHTFDPNAGYGGRGMIRYTLSDAYDHANSPAQNNGTIGYHADSYQSRKMLDTHFAGSISKDLYYYDIKNGVESARTNRSGDIVVTDPDAIAHLEALYAEYLAAPDNIVIAGYNVDPGSPNACSACHDVHAANKLLGRFDAPEGWLQRNLNSEPHVAATIAMSSGFGETHGNYISDSFSRTGAGASCLPCHDGRQFVTLAAGGYMSPGPVWAPLGCTTCHDMVGSGDEFDARNLRTFHAAHEFTFNSGETVTELGRDATCFECHKGRTGGHNVAGVVDAPQGVRSYDISYLHYNPSFATLMGDDAKMAATYEGQTYSGRFTHPGQLGQMGCSDCHEVHRNEALIHTDANCTGCHAANGGAYDPAVLQARTKEYADRVVETVEAQMLAAYNGGNYSVDFHSSLKTALDSIFEDTNNAAQVRERLLTHMKGRVSYFPNKAIAQAVASWKVFYYEDAGAWAHNSKFARQVLYDAITSLGGDVTGLTRPAP